MPREDNFRQDLEEKRKEKREERSAPIKSYGCISGKTVGINPLLGMISCVEGGFVRKARLFIPESIGEDWAIVVMLGQGLSFQTILGPDKLTPGFTDLGDIKISPSQVVIVRAHYAGDVARDFEYCLDYAIEVK